MTRKFYIEILSKQAWYFSACEIVCFKDLSMVELSELLEEVLIREYVCRLVDARCKNMITLEQYKAAHAEILKRGESLKRRKYKCDWLKEGF